MGLTGRGAAKRGIVVGELPLHRNAQACRPKSSQAVFRDPDARTACRYGGREA